jgi:hypothetical protein
MYIHVYIPHQLSSKYPKQLESRTGLSSPLCTRMHLVSCLPALNKIHTAPHKTQDGRKPLQTTTSSPVVRFLFPVPHPSSNAHYLSPSPSGLQASTRLSFVSVCLCVCVSVCGMHACVHKYTLTHERTRTHNKHVRTGERRKGRERAREKDTHVLYMHSGSVYHF